MKLRNYMWEEICCNWNALNWLLKWVQQELRVEHHLELVMLNMCKGSVF